MIEPQERLDSYKNRSLFNNATGLDAAIKRFDVDRLAELYASARKEAPSRTARNKHYLFERHGITKTGDFTNRFEEHLAIALFNAHRSGEDVAVPGRGSLRFVDYQIPLKARRTDTVGKLDALGLFDNGQVCLIELKAPNIGRGDSPLRAMLEVLTYAAVIDGQSKPFLGELQKRYPEASETDPLTLLILGPTSWWDAWIKCEAAGKWREPFADLCATLGDRLGVAVACASLDGYATHHLTLGLQGVQPVIKPVPTLSPVAWLPSL